MLQSLFLTAAEKGLTKVEYDNFSGQEVSLVLQRLAGTFSGNFNIDQDDLTGLMERFMDEVVPNPPDWGKPSPGFENWPVPKGWKRIPLWGIAWEENDSPKKVVIDALLYRAGLEAKTAGNIKNVQIIDRARELLRMPDDRVFASYYQGTSSASMKGIEEAHARILSLLKIKEAGIIRRTGGF